MKICRLLIDTDIIKIVIFFRMEGILIKNLLQKVLKKDDESERILFEMFYNKVYKTAYLFTKDHYLAQDVVQETFEKAFKQLHRLKNPENAGAWLGSIATNTAIDLMRKKKRWNDSPTEDVYIESELSKVETNSIDMEIERVFLIKSIRTHISNLKEEYKQVIVLRYLYEMKENEIAEALGIKTGTVKSRLHRAKLKLKEMLMNSYEKEESANE